MINELGIFSSDDGFKMNIFLYGIFLCISPFLYIFQGTKKLLLISTKLQKGFNVTGFLFLVLIFHSSRFSRCQFFCNVSQWTQSCSHEGWTQIKLHVWNWEILGRGSSGFILEGVKGLELS